MNKYIYILTLFVLSCTSNEVDEIMENTIEQLNVEDFVESDDDIQVYDSITIPYENLLAFVNKIEKDERFLSSDNLNDFYKLSDTNVIYFYQSKNVYAPLIENPHLEGTSCLLGVFSFGNTKSIVVFNGGESCGVYSGFSIGTIINNELIEWSNTNGSAGEFGYSWNINVNQKDNRLYFSEITNETKEEYLEKLEFDSENLDYYIDEISEAEGKLNFENNKWIKDTTSVSRYKIKRDTKTGDVLDTIK